MLWSLNSVKSEHLDAKRGPRGSYTQMDAARKVVLKSSLEGVPAGWVFDHFKDVDDTTASAMLN